MLNAILVVLIIVSFVAYFYFKTMQFRTTLPVRKKWYKAKAGVALGVFLILFGINTIIIQQKLISIIVAIVFIVVGGMEAYFNFKRARHEGQYVKEEFELNRDVK